MKNVVAYYNEISAKHGNEGRLEGRGMHLQALSMVYEELLEDSREEPVPRGVSIEEERLNLLRRLRLPVDHLGANATIAINTESKFIVLHRKLEFFQFLDIRTKVACCGHSSAVPGD